MKKITFITLLITGLSFGQFFEQEQDQSQQAENEENIFSNEPQGGAPDHEMGTDAGGVANPEVPLDDWAFLLPLAGIAVGVYYIRRKKAMAPKA